MNFYDLLRALLPGHTWTDEERSEADALIDALEDKGNSAFDVKPAAPEQTSTPTETATTSGGTAGTTGEQTASASTAAPAETVPANPSTP